MVTAICILAGLLVLGVVIRAFMIASRSTTGGKLNEGWFYHLTYPEGDKNDDMRHE